MKLIRNPHSTAIFISVIFFIVGAALLFSSLYTGWKGYIISTWPQTDARILSAEAELKRSNGGYNYKVVLLYEYSIDGIAMQGNTIGLKNPSFIELKQAQQVIQKQFYPGKTMKVFYNPSHPREVFLEGGIPIFSIVFIFIGTLLLSFGLLLIKRVGFPDEKPATIAV